MPASNPPSAAYLMDSSGKMAMLPHQPAKKHRIGNTPPSTASRNIDSALGNIFRKSFIAPPRIAQVYPALTGQALRISHFKMKLLAGEVGFGQSPHTRLAGKQIARLRLLPQVRLAHPFSGRGDIQRAEIIPAKSARGRLCHRHLDALHALARR